MRYRIGRAGQAVRDAWLRYRGLPVFDLSRATSDAEHGLIRAFLYWIMPAWVGAGVADWWCHRKTDIEHTAGTRESRIHALQFGEIGIPLLMGLLCRINAGALLTMWGTAFVHELTGIWDVAVASRHRELGPAEQHIHGFLEVLPFTACIIASCLHWDALRSLMGRGRSRPDFHVRMKECKIPDGALAMTGGMLLAVALLYGNELYRCRRARDEPHYNTGRYPPKR